MGLLQIYSTNTPYSKTERQTFCDCSEKNKNVKSQIPAVCHCGEDACRTMEWQWDTTLVQQQSDVNGPNISFHRSYSQGTSMVRGQKELRKGVIHYWEIKVDSWFPGTDLVRTLFGFHKIIEFNWMQLNICCAMSQFSKLL